MRDEETRAPPEQANGQSIIESAIGSRGPLSGAFWAELHTFLAVAELKSVNRAADALGLGRNTVTRQIRRLHDVLGQQLVVLTKQGAFLTQKGEELARELARIDRELHAAASSLRGKGSAPEGAVRVGVSDGLGFIFVVPQLKSFSSQYPRVQIQLKRPRTYDSLRENKMDIIAGFSHDPGADVLSLQLGWVHFLPFAGRSYIDRKGWPILDRAADHEFVATERFFGPGHTWLPWQSLLERGRVVHSCDTSISYAVMVKAGIGIGLLPSYNVCEPGLVPLDLNVRVEIPLYAVALRERLKARPIKLAFDMLQSTLGTSPWLRKPMSLDIERNGMPEGYRMLLNLG